MSKQLDLPLLLEPKPSLYLKRMLVLAHGLALLACAISYLPIGFKATLAAVICLHLFLVVRNLNSTQHTIKHSEAFAWQVWGEHGFEPVEILYSTVITTFAVFLHIKRENADKQTILVLSDTLPEDVYRHLIIRLRTTVVK